MPIKHTPTTKDQRASRTSEILIRLSTEEKKRVDASALAVHLSVVSFIRSIGLGRRPRSLTDLTLIKDVLCVHGDVGRLGGILKMWLADQAAVPCVDHAQVRRVLTEVEQVQKQLLQVAKQARQGKTGMAVALSEAWTPMPLNGPKRSVRVRVPTSQLEKDSIQAAASRVGTPAAVYLRNGALIYRPTTVIDPAAIEQLRAVNHDLATTGRGLKHTITEDIGPMVRAPTAQDASLRALDATHRQLLILGSHSQRLITKR